MSEPARQDALLAVPAPAERRVDADGVADPVARVLLDTPVPHLDRLFDYLVPPRLDAAAGIGTRVTVRFGGKNVRGWIWERGATTTHPGRLAPLGRVVSDLPVLTPATMGLVGAVAARAAGTRADVMRLAVPARHAAAERAERDAPAPPLPVWRPPDVDAAGWGAYLGGPELLGELAAGHRPRAVWTALPGRAGLVAPWQTLLARALRAALADGRGGLVVVATTARAEALARRLERELEGEPVEVLSAEHGPARRYRAFVRLLLGRARLAVGTRAAAFAPVPRLGLAAVWDDGDDRLDEPRAPYVHARTVLALRSGLEGAGLLIAGHARSVEAQGYVERGWAADLSAPRNLVRRAVARVEAPGAPELDAEGASGRARIPSLAHRALRRALERGPALVQVPRGGYVLRLACGTCRAGARCPACGGPLSRGRDGATSCRWCARAAAPWTCPACGGTALRMTGVGSTRTGEELGRAFPGVPVVVSGAREDHGVIAAVDSRPRLVVATPGAEPVAEGGYRAVLLLDGAALSSRPQLGAACQALRLWANAAALARADARVILLGGADAAVAQALVRWDHAGFARRELAERAELRLPPAWRCARLDGPPRAVGSLLDAARAAGWDVLGPVPAPGAGAPADTAPTGAPAGPAPPGAQAGAPTGAPASGVVHRALIRAPSSRGRELADALALWARERSAHRQEAVRVELDPTLLW